LGGFGELGGVKGGMRASQVGIIGIKTPFAKRRRVRKPL